MTWILPSPMERRQGERRMKALQLGMKVRMLSLDDWAKERLDRIQLAQYLVWTDQQPRSATLWRIQTERSRGRRHLMLGVGIYCLETFRCFLIHYRKTLSAWVRIKEVFGWPSMTPRQSLNLRRSSHTSISFCSFSRAAHNFYSQQGLSLLRFSRIAKKERDACIQRCFEFSMHPLNHITD